MTAAPLGVYIHWPFCQSKCPYCDFNSHVREAVDQARWRAGLLRELTEMAKLVPERRVESVFFGGGTPSLMPPETVGALLETIRKLWPCAEDWEVTLEANPGSSDAGRFAGYREAGVNRLSLGVQALNDDALRFLGRRHSVAEALDAVALAREIFGRFSFDLIYARPGQDQAAWDAELTRALAEGPEHLSLYQLTIEENTVFHGAWRRGELAMPGEAETAALFEMTQARMETAGLPAYEISNHARPGAACRHNLIYWRYQDYLGIGPGAHGRITRAGEKVALRQHRAPEAWLAAVERDGHATRQERRIAAEDRLTELLLCGLRLNEGVVRDAFRRELGAEPEALLPHDRLAHLADEGLLILDAGGLRASAAGRQTLNALLGYLLPTERQQAAG